MSGEVVMGVDLLIDLCVSFAIRFAFGMVWRFA